MMKRIILFVAGICFAFSGMAQKQNVQSASNFLNEKDYSKALEYIEKALNDASTKDEPKTWYTKGRIYMVMNEEAANKGKGYYKEGAKAFIKAQELKANYENDVIKDALLVAAYNYFNELATAYNKSNFPEAYDNALAVIQIHDLEGGKKYAGNKSFDTVTSQARLYGAYSAYYGNRYNDAMPLLLQLKDDPISKSPNVFWLLGNVYKSQNKDAEFLATIEEGEKLFSGNENLRNEELNYYIKSGKQDVLIKKLEDAVAKNPDNAEYQYNLANSLNNMAFPKDAAGKEQSKPSNFEDLIKRAEEAYMRALKIEPNNVGYNYNTGVLYFNKGTVINEQMNALGNTPADTKKYDELKVKRDALFEQALPYLEKSYTLLEPQLSTLNKEDKSTYQYSIVAMRQIYAIQNKMDKASAMKAKLDALKK